MENETRNMDRKVLLEIENLLTAGIYPSIAKLAQGIGKANSLNSVLLATERLRKKGFLLKDEENKIKSLTESGKAFLGGMNLPGLKNRLSTPKIPILWAIACGNPIFAEEDVRGYVEVSEELLKGSFENYFILEAEGDSMNKDGIESGDLLLMRAQNYANNGDTVLALLDYETATLKEFVRNSKGFIQLLPHSTNEKHRPIIVRDNLHIQGVLEANLWKINL